VFKRRLNYGLGMAKSRVTRRQLFVAAAPVVAAVPLAKLALAETAKGDPSAAHQGMHAAMGHKAIGHAAMIGLDVPAPGGPNDLDALLYPPEALSHQPGRVREYTLAAVDGEVEVMKGVTFAAWMYNGTVPGPVIRATEDDLLRVTFTNAGSHPHTIHFHGIHPANMDGVFEVVQPGCSYTY
jgi:FtsP/CotA-like multicopper oxidase with cupredoxin domain